MVQRTKDALRAVVARSGGHAQVYLLSYPFLIDTESYAIPEVAPVYDAGRALNDLQRLGDDLQARGIAELERRARDDAVPLRRHRQGRPGAVASTASTRTSSPTTPRPGSSPSARPAATSPSSSTRPSPAGTRPPEPSGSPSPAELHGARAHRPRWDEVCRRVRSRRHTSVTSWWGPPSSGERRDGAHDLVEQGCQADGGVAGPRRLARSRGRPGRCSSSPPRGRRARGGPRRRGMRSATRGVSDSSQRRCSSVTVPRSTGSRWSISWRGRELHGVGLLTGSTIASKALRRAAHGDSSAGRSRIASTTDSPDSRSRSRTRSSLLSK